MIHHTFNESLVDDLEYIINETSLELKKLQGKNILLTGGGGFLGYYFINLFLYLRQNKLFKPINLTINDNFIRGKSLWFQNLSQNNNINIINKDITKLRFSSRFKFDYIIHAASIASPTYYRKYPLETINDATKSHYH